VSASATAAIVACLAACGPHRPPPPGTTIGIAVSWAGASPSDVEVAITNPIEDALALASGLHAIRSTSREGRADIAVEFAPAVDPLAAEQATHARVGAILAKLPPGIEPPVVWHEMARDAVVLRFIARSRTLPAPAVGEALDPVVSEFDAIGGVGFVELCGVGKRRIAVMLDPAALAAAGVVVSEVASALRGLDPLKGSVGVEQLAPTIVARRDGVPVRLGDVGHIVDDAAPPACTAASSSGESPIEGIVYAQNGADVAEVRRQVEAALPALRRNLPPAVAIDVLPDERPLALVAIVPVDGRPAATRLRAIRDAVVAAGAATVVIAGGERPSELGLAADEIEIRAWPDGADLDRAVRAKLAGLPDIAVEDAPPHVVALTGPDLDTLERLARDVAQQLASRPPLASLGVVDAPRPRLDIEVDRAAAADLGVQVADIAELSRVALEGDDVGGVVLRFAGEPLDPTWTRIARVRSSMGSTLPVSQVVKVATATSTTIRHRNRQRWVGVRARGADAALAAFVTGLSLPAGYRAYIDGAEHDASVEAPPPTPPAPATVPAAADAFARCTVLPQPAAPGHATVQPDDMACTHGDVFYSCPASVDLTARRCARPTRTGWWGGDAWCCPGP